jgi:arginase
MRVALIYATWPVTPFGSTWYKLADALRAAGLGQALTAAGHQVEEHVLAATGPAATELRGGFELSAQVAAQCRAAVETGAFPVVICGSCGVAAVGAVAGLGGEGTGILWMDAHPDINTPETSGSGMFDGMALSTALGECWRQMAGQVAGLQPASADNVCLFGARDIDPGEAEYIAAHGIPNTADLPLDAGRLSACERVYVHLDMDVHDGLTVRANNFAVPGGPSAETVRAALVEASRGLPVAALSITGLDPAAPDADLAMRIAIDHARAVCDGASDRKLSAVFG